MTLHLTSIVSHHEPEDATQQRAPKPGECPACAGTGRSQAPSSPAIRPQSLAREAYESAWAAKQALRG